MEQQKELAVKLFKSTYEIQRSKAIQRRVNLRYIDTGLFIAKSLILPFMIIVLADMTAYAFYELYLLPAAENAGISPGIGVNLFLFILVFVFFSVWLLQKICEDFLQSWVQHWNPKSVADELRRQEEEERREFKF